MPVVACKLPAGLQIDHNDQKIVLVGANIGERLAHVSPNGDPADNAARVAGFGLTELTDVQAAAFEDWSAKSTYVNGDKAAGKLSTPFAAIDNGSILGPFKSKDEAVREVTALSSSISTGFEGLDPEKEGVEADPEGASEAPAKRRGK